MSFRDQVSPAASWLACRKPKAQASARLFCLPYAGGGASMFHSWPDLLPPEIEIRVIQLPGREKRFGERPFTRLWPLVQKLGAVLRPYLDRPFAIFGHSMGGLLGFELARQLRRQRDPSPKQLFISAHRAPQLPGPGPPIHKLPDSVFLMRLQAAYDLPPDVLDDAELVELYLPLLRADLAICETYVYTIEDPLDCPITVFGGAEDGRVGRAELSAWRVHTRDSFNLRIFPGNHFFLRSSRTLMLEALARDLKQISERLMRTA
jgi:medium-chain acyl-[acyl-carrier-protein] hydrolase